MKKERLLKIMLVIIMGVVLLAMSTNVFALSDDDFGLDITTDNTNTNSGTIDLTNSVPTPGNTNTNTNTNVDTNNANTNTNLNTNTNNYNTSLPEAGLAENTIVIVAVTVLAIIAIFAYTRIKYYKNI